MMPRIDFNRTDRRRDSVPFFLTVLTIAVIVLAAIFVDVYVAVILAMRGVV